MKELLLIGTTVFTLATGGITAGSIQGSTSTHTRGQHVSVATLHRLEIKAQDAINEAKMAKLRDAGIRVDKTLAKLKKYVGKTWYVFSGDTPGGWDCSGLTLWFYEQLGVTLEHRASKQAHAGYATKDPKPGDIVVFKYKGYKSAYHVGIYVGEDQMIHSPRPGYITTIGSIKEFGGDYSDVSYRRIIETN